MDNELNSANLEKYKHKLYDLISYIEYTQMNLYYEECILEGIKRANDLQLDNKKDIVNTINSLINDMSSIINNMIQEITLDGCKELLCICCEIFVFCNGTYDEEKIIDRMQVEIWNGFVKINNNYAKTFVKSGATREDLLDTSINEKMINEYSTNHYFHQLDFYINLYFALSSPIPLKFAKVLAHSINVQFTRSTLHIHLTVDTVKKIRKDFLNRLDKYCNLLDELSKRDWTPPDNKLPTNYQIYFSSSSQGACYVATAIYGSYDHPSVLVLRKFRDEYLSKNMMGESFITYYYKYSPKFVEKHKQSIMLRLIIRKVLNGLVLLLKHFM